MRARYSAFVLGDVVFLRRTWAPETRPVDLDLVGSPSFRRLEILHTSDGGPDDASGVVQFRAHHDRGVLHERSRFRRTSAGWIYVDGVVDPPN